MRMFNEAERLFEDAIRRAEDDRARLDVEIEGLRMALDRLRRTASSEGPATPTSVEVLTDEVAAWRGLTRTDAVLRALTEAGGRMHRKAITDALAAAGRAGDSIEAVSAALAYLSRGDEPRVENVGAGVWRLIPAEEIDSVVPEVADDGDPYAPKAVAVD